MPSKTKEARLQQKTNFEKKLAERLSLLGEKGLDSKQITRDSAVKKLRAQIRETNDRLKAIEAREHKIEEMAKAKAEKSAAPKEKASKKKPKKEEAQESKRQQKKRAKKKEKDKEAPPADEN